MTSLAPQNSTSAVFSSVTLVSTLTSEQRDTASVTNIVVNAYGIQTDSLSTSDPEEIFDLFETESPSSPSSPALPPALPSLTVQSLAQAGTIKVGDYVIICFHILNEDQKLAMSVQVDESSKIAFKHINEIYPNFVS